MHAGIRSWMVLLGLLIAGAADAGTAADFGDAPDDDLVCQAGGTVFPANYPTQSTTVNAAPGRTAPFHLPPLDPEAFVVLGSQDPGVTYEAEALEAVSCDWVTGPPCDHDNGVLLLCFGTMGCPSGVVFSGLDPDCGRWGAGVFGPVPPTPAIGRYFFEVSRGATAAQPAFVNVTADFELNASWGGSGEWILADQPIPVVPWQTQLFVTAPFLVPTVVAPCPNALLAWCVLPFWTRFMVSPEAVTPAFPGGDWDGSGVLAGYPFGETEDVVPAGDPGVQPLDPLPTVCHESTAVLRVSFDPPDVFCVGGVDLRLTSTSVGLTQARLFAQPPLVAFSDVPVQLELELVGGHPAIGPVLVRESIDLNLGKLSDVVVDGAGNVVSAESFFDVAVVLEFSPTDAVVIADGAALRLDAGRISGFPAVGQTYSYPAGGRPLALEDRDTGELRGWLCGGELTPTSEVACGEVIFRDGLETGDARRWSSTVTDPLR